MSTTGNNATVVEEPWFRLATRCAIQIRKRCGAPDRLTEDRIMRVFRAALRPRKRAGRRPSDETVKAAEMWLSGTRGCRVTSKGASFRHYLHRLWQGIYREVYPDFTHLDKLTRQYRTGVLRRNVKAYLRRKGHKWLHGFDVST
jgi:hypothetical protein